MIAFYRKAAPDADDGRIREMFEAWQK